MGRATANDTQSDAGQRHRIAGRAMTNPPKPINQIIEESVQGDHDAWPLDPTYKVEGSYHDRYKDGDNQIVLWEIYRCAKKGSAIPEWAEDAFIDLFMK